MARNPAVMLRLIARRQHAARLRNLKHKQRARQAKVRLLAALICTVAAFTMSLCLENPEPLPMHTSILTGQNWLSELLTGHPSRF
jgi:hypothetical protein